MSKAVKCDRLSWKYDLFFSYDCLLGLRVKCYGEESLRGAAQSGAAETFLLLCGLFKLQLDRTTIGTSYGCRAAKWILACLFCSR